MKKIIKPGRKEAITTIKRFRCATCGCVFECDKDGYRSDRHYNILGYFSDCLECGRIASEIRM